MTEHDRQFDDLERRVSEQFRRDLRTLLEPAGPVPAQVDKAILERARRRVTRPQPRIIRLRWAASAVAAAAVVVIGLVLYQAADHPSPQSAIPYPQLVDGGVAQRAVSAKISPDLAEGRADIDNNGRVDILDAFRLARHIESRGPAEMKWDLNGDGQVDRADVDAAAFAAVRLDKGV
jgi:hypothetical protein